MKKNKRTFTTEKKNKFEDFYEAYHYLRKHSLFKNQFERCLDIDVVKVNPRTNRVSDNEKMNTLTRVWLETGAPGVHDLDLDCGGATFEEAIINLANLVYEKSLKLAKGGDD